MNNDKFPIDDNLTSISSAIKKISDSYIEFTILSENYNHIKTNELAISENIVDNNKKIQNIDNSVTNILNIEKLITNNNQDIYSSTHGIIYLVQPCELLNTNRYKIGRSSKNNLDRCKNGYKKGTRYICIFECPDSISVENEIKKIFNIKFKLIAGKEYFEGDENELRDEFIDIFNSFYRKKKSDEFSVLSENYNHIKNNQLAISENIVDNNNKIKNIDNKYDNKIKNIEQKLTEIINNDVLKSSSKSVKSTFSEKNKLKKSSVSFQNSNEFINNNVSFNFNLFWKLLIKRQELLIKQQELSLTNDISFIKNEINNISKQLIKETLKHHNHSQITKILLEEYEILNNSNNQNNLLKLNDQLLELL
jgi:hypothetical protein